MNTATFSSVATQLLTTDKVELVGKRLPIRRIGHRRLKSIAFTIEGREQNAEKPSRRGRSRRGAGLRTWSGRGSLRSPWTEHGAMPKRKQTGTQ